MHLIKGVLLREKFTGFFYFRSVFPGSPEVDRQTTQQATVCQEASKHSHNSLNEGDMLRNVSRR